MVFILVKSKWREDGDSPCRSREVKNSSKVGIWKQWDKLHCWSGKGNANIIMHSYFQLATLFTPIIVLTS